MTGGGRSFSLSRSTRRRSATSISEGSLGSDPTRLVSFSFSKWILLFDLFLVFSTFLRLFVEPFGPAPMTPELSGLIATLRRGSLRWLAFTVDRIRTVYALPPGENRATPIGMAAPVRPGKGRRNKSKLIFLLFHFSKRSEIDCLRVPQFPKSVSFRGEGEGGVTGSS